MIRYMTAGESHGPGLAVIVEGLPSGLPLEAGMIDRQLARRQQGYGRGGRMKIERDRVQIMGGVRHGLTLGSPLAMIIPNLDWENWKTAMGAESSPGGGNQAVTSPRPGHADLAGGMKHGFSDLRNVLERASARETAARSRHAATLAATIPGALEVVLEESGHLSNLAEPDVYNQAVIAFCRDVESRYCESGRGADD